MELVYLETENRALLLVFVNFPNSYRDDWAHLEAQSRSNSCTSDNLLLTLLGSWLRGHRS